MVSLKRLNFITIKNYVRNYFNDTKFYSIFLLKPLKKKNWGEKDYTTSHFDKGEDYHLRFENLPGRKNIWDLEKIIIENFLSNKKLYNQLDFASGTGRIAKFLETKVTDQSLLDSSQKMLEYSKTILNLNNTTFIHEDFTKINLNKKFDLITAFRFFPNAEPFLRKKAMSFISDHLSDSGILILNNHKNFWSIPFLLERLTFRSNGFGMTHKEVKELVKTNNLKIYQYKSVGLITNKEKSLVIPWSIISKLENFLFKIYSNHLIGYNVIYLIGR